MDTRLSVMLPEALDIKNGEVKIVKVAGGVICAVGAHTDIMSRLWRYGINVTA